MAEPTRRASYNAAAHALGALAQHAHQREPKTKNNNRSPDLIPTSCAHLSPCS